VDPNATPWRVLEDPVETGPASASPAGPEPAARWTIQRSTLVVGAAAVALAVGAFVLAAGTTSGGLVVVDGGSALPAVVSGGPSQPVGSARVGAGGILVVEIVGAVDHPGVFELPAGARIGDLVDAAGGYGPRVDTERAGRELNLAGPLHDGDHIRVPSRDDAAADGPVASGGGAAAGGGAPAGPIDLNRATAEELDTLPGVGPATVAKILASREQQPFAAVEDLRTRKLLGEKTFANLKDLVTVR
jgi:competence protein ComEA